MTDLERYGRHEEGCDFRLEKCQMCSWNATHATKHGEWSTSDPHTFTPKPCSCGFASALARAQASASDYERMTRDPTFKALLDYEERVLTENEAMLPHARVHEYCCPRDGDPKTEDCEHCGPNKAACLDCGLPYESFPLDVCLPRSQWLEIHPDENGLLCAMCIVKRAAKVPRVTCIHAILEIAPPTPPGVRHVTE